MWLCRAAQTGAALLLAGTVALRLLAWGIPASAAVPRWNRLAFVTWCALLLAAVLQLGLVAARMGDIPLRQVFHGHVLGGVLRGTHFGAVWQVRIALLAGLLVVGLIGTIAQRSGGRQLTAISDVAAALLIVSFLTSLVAAGHAQASDRRLWLLPTDMTHAVAAGAWPGGLLPLMLLLAKARRHPESLAAAITITQRFSRLSVVAVGLLTLSGSLNGYALVGTFHGLWTNAFGRLVACKALLLVTMVAWGAMNKRLIEDKPLNYAHATVGRLWRNVAVECVLAMCVVPATEALAMSNPTASVG